MRSGRIALIAVGLAWLAVDLYLMLGNVVLRETRLGTIARFLDSLPKWASNPAFVCLWGILLLGWTVPLMVGLRVFRQKSLLR